jgi:hypothetical protein
LDALLLERFPCCFFLFACCFFLIASISALRAETSESDRGASAGAADCSSKGVGVNSGDWRLEVSRSLVFDEDELDEVLEREAVLALLGDGLLERLDRPGVRHGACDLRSRANFQFEPMV